MEPERIAALVVTHNRLEKLRITVARLLDEGVDHLVVFDNASTDGTAEWLAGINDPRLAVIRHPANIGGAGGFSLGLRHVAERLDPDWTIMTDDDGRPLPGCVGAFRAMDKTGWDAVGAAVLTPAGEVCEMNRPYRNPFWNMKEFSRTLVGGGRAGFHLPDAAYRLDAPVQAIDMTSFVGLFLSAGAVRRGGYPDRRLFIYGDDQLHTLSLRRKGMRIAFAPQVRFEHDTQSIQAGTGALRPMWKVYYNYRNALLAYRVAAGPWFWALVPVLAVKWRRKGRGYGPDRARFRQVLRLAMRDGLRGDLSRTHEEVLRLAEG